MGIKKPGEYRGKTGGGLKIGQRSAEHNYERKRKGEKGTEAGTPQVGVGPGRIAERMEPRERSAPGGRKSLKNSGR